MPFSTPTNTSVQPSGASAIAGRTSTWVEISGAATTNRRDGSAGAAVRPFHKTTAATAARTMADKTGGDNLLLSGWPLGAGSGSRRFDTAGQVIGNRNPRFADVAEPTATIGIEAAAQQFHDRRRQILRQRRPVEIVLQHRGEDVGDRVAGKCLPSRTASRRGRRRRPRHRHGDRPIARAPAPAPCSRRCRGSVPGVCR